MPVVVEDTLGVYNITLPDSSWEIYKGDVEDWHLLVLKFVGDDYMAFNVSMTEYDHDWNWDDEQLEINNSFTVLKTGNIEQNGHSLRYNFVITDSDNFESRDLAYYLTLLDTVKRRNFTITLKTNSSPGYEDRFCELSYILRSFDPGKMTKKEAVFHEVLSRLNPQ